MQIKDTVNITDVLSLTELGIFKTAIDPTDVYASLRDVAPRLYYIERSYSKELSNIVKIHIEYYADDVLRRNDALGSIIRNKFRDKWTAIYNQLHLEYASLDERSYEDTNRNTTTDNDTKTITEHIDRINNDTSSKSVTDTIEYASDTSTKTSTKADEQTVTEYDNENNRYGYNSVSPVPIATNTENEKVTKTLDPTKNFVDEDSQKRGSDTTTISDATTDNRDEDVDRRSTEEDNRSLIEEKSRKILGRSSSPSDLIQKEIDFRARNIFLDIMFDDIDSVLTLSVY